MVVVNGLILSVQTLFRVRNQKTLSLFFAVFNVNMVRGLVNYRMFGEVMLNVRDRKSVV